MEQLAELVVSHSLDVKHNERVAVAGSASASAFALRVARAVRHRGAHPFFMLHPPAAESFVTADSTEKPTLSHVHLASAIVSCFDAGIYIFTGEGMAVTHNMNPATLRDCTYYRTQMGMPWRSKRCVTVGYPCGGALEGSVMSNSTITALLHRACFLNTQAPVDAWRRHSDYQQRILGLLEAARCLHISAPGIDLTVSVDGCKFVASDGARSMPDGEVYTSPHPSSVHGHAEFPGPFLLGGHWISGVRLSFAKGQLTEATASKNGDILAAYLLVDDGAAKLGELGIGTNAALTDYTGFSFIDEKAAGTFHIALGQSYPEIGADNRSAVHLDLVASIRQHSTITADGRIVMRNGHWGL